MILTPPPGGTDPVWDTLAEVKKVTAKEEGAQAREQLMREGEPCPFNILVALPFARGAPLEICFINNGGISLEVEMQMKQQQLKLDRKSRKIDEVIAQCEQLRRDHDESDYLFIYFCRPH